MSGLVVLWLLGALPLLLVLVVPAGLGCVALAQHALRAWRRRA